ncbi:MAG: TonB-dependent receptor [Cytophagaceae bacterium]
MRLTLLVVLFVLLRPLYSIAQTCNHQLEGVVTDTLQEPIPGALLHLTHDGHHLHAVTDSLGIFRFQGLCSGTYNVHIDYVGFIHKNFSIVVPSSEQVQCVLVPQSQTGSVVVEAFKEKETLSTLPINQLDGEALFQQNGQTLTESIQRIPGVSMLSTGATISKPVVQGMYGSRVLLLSNGVRLEGQQWGNEHAPEIDPFLASNIQVVRGAQSIKYGSDAIGGVILTNPEKLGLRSGWHGATHTGFFSNNRLGYLSGILNYSPEKIPALSFRVQGTFRKAGNSKTPNYWLDNTGLQELNFSWAGQYRWKSGSVESFYSQFNTTLGIFTGAHISNLTDLQNVIQTGNPYVKAPFSYDINNPKQDITHELWSVKLNQQTSIGRWTLRYARQYNRRAEYDISTLFNNGGKDPSLQFELTTHTFQINLDHRIGKWSSSQGLWGQLQSNTYEGRYFLPNFRSHAAAYYWLIERTIGKLTWELGTRLEAKRLQSYYYENNVLVNPVRDFVSPVATGGVNYKWNATHVSKLWLGSSYRAPNVSELYSNGVHHGVAAYEIGNKALNPEQAINLSLHHSYSKKKMNIYAQAYSYYFFNYIYLQPVQPPTLTIRGAFPTFEYRQSSAWYWGGDLGWSDTLAKRHFVQSTLSFVSAKNATNGDWIWSIPSTRWNQRWVYHKPITEKVKAYIGAELQWVFQKQQYEVEQDYLPPPPTYLLGNAELGVNWKQGHQQWRFQCVVKNIWNQVYRDYLDRFRYYQDAPGRNIQVRVQYEF